MASHLVDQPLINQLPILILVNWATAFCQARSSQVDLQSVTLRVLEFLFAALAATHGVEFCGHLVCRCCLARFKRAGLRGADAALHRYLTCILHKVANEGDSDTCHRSTPNSSIKTKLRIPSEEQVSLALTFGGVCPLPLGAPQKAQGSLVVPLVQEYFEVDRVLEERLVDGETEVLIKWLNYDEQSWEPLSSIKECPHVLEEFRHRLRSGEPLHPPPPQSLAPLTPSQRHPTRPAPSQLTPPILSASSQTTPHPVVPVQEAHKVTPLSTRARDPGLTARSNPHPRSLTRTSVAAQQATISPPSAVLAQTTTSTPPSREGDPVVSFLALEAHAHTPVSLFLSRFLMIFCQISCVV